MNKHRRTNKEIISEKLVAKEKLEKDIAKLKKQENSKKKNKNSWMGELGDNSFTMIYDSLYNSKAYRDLKPKSKDIYIGMRCYSKGQFVFNYPYRIYKTRCTKATFQVAIKDLVEHGFIEVVASGKFNHRPNEYCFSDKFHNWQQECNNR